MSNKTKMILHSIIITQVLYCIFAIRFPFEKNKISAAYQVWDIDEERYDFEQDRNLELYSPNRLHRNYKLKKSKIDAFILLSCTTSNRFDTFVEYTNYWFDKNNIAVGNRPVLLRASPVERDHMNPSCTHSPHDNILKCFRGAWEMMVANKYEYTFLFEDDSRLEMDPQLWFQFSDLSANAPLTALIPEDAEAVDIAKPHRLEPYEQLFGGINTWAVLWSLRGAHKMLKLTDQMCVAMDVHHYACFQGFNWTTAASKFSFYSQFIEKLDQNAAWNVSDPTRIPADMVRGYKFKESLVFHLKCRTCTFEGQGCPNLAELIASGRKHCPI